MGQCCEDEARSNAQFEPLQLKVRKYKSLEISRDFISPTFDEEQNRNKLQETQQRLIQEQRLQEQWLNLMEKKISIKEQKKQEFVDFHQFMHLYQKCLHSYKAHDIDSAHDITKELQTFKVKIKQNRNISEEHFLYKLKEIEEHWQQNNFEHQIEHFNQGSITQIQKQMKDLQYFEKELSREPFIEKYNKKGIKISTRSQQNTIGAQISTQIQVPFEQFAMLLTQVDYFADFIPFCQKSYLLKDSARNSKIGYSVFNFPFVSRREGFFKGIAYLRFKTTKDVFLCIRSLEPDELKQQGIDASFNEDYVALKYKYFVVRYQPLRARVGRLTFSFCIDNGIHFLPQFVEEYVTRKLGKELFYNLLDISSNFKGSKWEESMNKNPQFSMFLRQKIKEVLQGLQPEQSQKQ